MGMAVLGAVMALFLKEADPKKKKADIEGSLLLEKKEVE